MIRSRVSGGAVPAGVAGAAPTGSVISRQREAAVKRSLRFRVIRCIRAPRERSGGSSHAWAGRAKPLSNPLGDRLQHRGIQGGLDLRVLARTARLRGLEQVIEAGQAFDREVLVAALLERLLDLRQVLVRDHLQIEL